METAYHVSSVLSSIVIISLCEEGDCRFVGHLRILWKLHIILAVFYLAL